MIKNVLRLRARSLLSPHIVVLVGVAAVMAVTFAVIVATLNRGFDWSDEGFVYAMIASNRVSTSEVWGFQYLLNPLYELTGSSVLVFRILRLFGYVALGVILTVLARALLRSKGIELGRVGWLLVGLVAQIGTLAAWSYPPRYLGYNELSSWLTQLGAALLIFLLLMSRDAPEARPAWRWWLWPITGGILSALVLAKVSAGLFLSLLAIGAALLAADGGAWWKRVAGLLGGLMAGFLLMWAAGAPLASFFETSARFGADPSAQAGSGHSIRAILATYLGSMSVTVAALAVPILLAGVILLVVRGFRTDSDPARRVIASAENVTLFLSFVLAIVLVTVNVFPGALDRWTSLGVGYAFLLVLAVLSLAVLASPAARAANPPRRLAAGVAAFGLFALAPLISALGTNNRIFGATVFSATMWATGAAVGLVLLWQRSEAVSAAVRALPLLLLGVIVASSGIAVAVDVYRHPYRTVPYFTQNSTVEVGDLRGIRLTEGEADLYTWLHDAGRRLEAQDVPALSIATPGALLAFNASGWSAIWPGSDWASSIAKSCTDDVPDEMFVLQAATEEEGDARHDRLVAGLAACGINFPADFQVVERHASDVPAQDVRVWRLR